MHLCTSPTTLFRTVYRLTRTGEAALGRYHQQMSEVLTTLEP